MGTNISKVTIDFNTEVMTQLQTLDLGHEVLGKAFVYEDCFRYLCWNEESTAKDNYNPLNFIFNDVNDMVQQPRTQH